MSWIIIIISIENDTTPKIFFVQRDNFLYKTALSGINKTSTKLHLVHPESAGY
jgi:hypothetical protein